VAGFRQSLRVVPDESFGSRLRTRRFADGLSQAELGERFGVRQQTVGAWERGERPQARMLAVLADYVGLPDEQALRELLDAEAPSSEEHAEIRRSKAASYTQQRAVEAFAKIVESYADLVKMGNTLSDDDRWLLSTAMTELGRLTAES
jgi:transcriptional regulator with XRE-family HTH domain